MLTHYFFSKTDYVNLLKVQNIFHGYERLIEHEKGYYTQLLEKIKTFENRETNGKKIWNTFK